MVSYVFRRVGARSPEQFAQMVIAGNPVVAQNSGEPGGWPYQWAEQSLVVAKLAYKDVVPGPASQQVSKTTGLPYKVWPLAVPDDYPVPTSAAAKEQLTQGGYRLAAVLKAIWP